MFFLMVKAWKQSKGNLGDMGKLRGFRRLSPTIGPFLPETLHKKIDDKGLDSQLKAAVVEQDYFAT